MSCLRADLMDCKQANGLTCCVRSRVLRVMFLLHCWCRRCASNKQQSVNQTARIAESLGHIVFVFTVSQIKYLHQIAIMCEESNLRLIDANRCPVCMKKCGLKSPRHAMMSHIRRSADPAHVVWRAKNWQVYFPHGKFRPAPSTQELLKTIEQEYGPNILHSLADEILKSRESTGCSS